MIFSPKASIVPQPLADRQYPDWIAQPSNIDSDWPQRSHTFEADGQFILQMTFLPDGRLVSLSRLGQIKIWDANCGFCLFTISGNEDKMYHSFSVSRDNGVAVPSSNSIKIWDANSGTLSQEIVLEDHDVYDVAFTDDGKFICSRSRRIERDVESNDSGLTSHHSEGEVVTESDQEIMCIHDVTTGECVREFGSGLQFSTPSFSPKGQWITVNETMLSRWDTCSDLLWMNLETDGKHSAWGFSVDGTLLASINAQRRPPEIKVWCTESTKCLHTYTIPDEDSKPMSGLTLTKDLLVYTSVTCDAVFINLKTGQVSRRPDIRVFHHLALSFDGKTLATLLLGGVIGIWDLASISQVEPPDVHLWPVEWVAPIADGNTILSLTRGDSRIWDISTLHWSATAHQTRYTGAYYAPPLKIATSTNKPLYATCSLEEVVIWHFDPVHGIKRLPQEYATAANQVENIAISDNGERLAVYLYDELHDERRAVQIWDLRTAGLLQTIDCGQYPGPAKTGRFRLALSHDGSRVAYMTDDSIKVQNVSNPQSLTTCTLPYPDDDSLSHLSFDNGRILAITRWAIQSFDDETGEEIGRYKLEDSTQKGGVEKSFINIEAIHSTNEQPRQHISDIMKPYYILRDDRWLHKHKEDILWLPPDYVPESACLVGSTVIVGTISGRLLFLYLRS